MKLWQERINTAYDNDQYSVKLLAEIYCTILNSGKDDGEYSDRDIEIMDKITPIIGEKMVNVLDSAVLENIKMAL